MIRQVYLMQIGLSLPASLVSPRSLGRLETAMPRFAAGVLFVPIALLLLIGSLGRYTADDWCWPIYVQERGFFSLQAHMYQTSFGRWASTGLLSGVGYLGPWTASVLPSVGIGLWLAAMSWFWREVLGRLLPAIILSQLIVLGVLLPAPERAIDGVIWQTGLLTYLPPLIIAFAGGALALRLNSPLIAAATAFVAAGFNESFMALEIAVLAAALLLANGQRKLILSALLAACLSAAIVVLSPGNDARRDALDTLPLGLLPIGVLYKQVLLLVIALPVALVFAAVAGAGLSGQIRLSRKLDPRLIVVLALVLSYLTLSPSIYGTNFLSGRAAMNVLLPLVVGAFFLGASLGGALTRRLSTFSLGLGALALAVIGCALLLPHYARFDAYRQELALQDARLAATAPGTAVVLDDPAVAPYETLWQLRQDPAFLINRCIASYYGLDSVRAP